jgi:hypothetical protein
MMETFDVTDREKTFYKDLEAMLIEDTRYIKAWLKIAQWTFTAAKKEQNKPRNERKLMEHYFAWKPSRKHRRCDTKTSRAPDETHPD